MERQSVIGMSMNRPHKIHEVKRTNMRDSLYCNYLTFPDLLCLKSALHHPLLKMSYHARLRTVR